MQKPHDSLFFFVYEKRPLRDYLSGSACISIPSIMNEIRKRTLPFFFVLIVLLWNTILIGIHLGMIW